MSDFLVALGLVLVLEGLVLAAFPAATKRAMENAIATPDQVLRAIGVVSAMLGVLAVWLVRG